MQCLTSIACWACSLVSSGQAALQLLSWGKEGLQGATPAGTDGSPACTHQARSRPRRGRQAGPGRGQDARDRRDSVNWGEVTGALSLWELAELGRGWLGVSHLPRDTPRGVSWSGHDENVSDRRRRAAAQRRTRAWTWVTWLDLGGPGPGHGPATGPGGLAEDDDTVANAMLVML